jgi:polyhydroxyalkanoate synthesis regulator phasin
MQIKDMTTRKVGIVQRISSLCLVALFFAQVGLGQGLKNVPGAELYDIYKKATVVVAVAVIAFLVAAFVVRRYQKRQSDSALPLDFTDLTKLEKQGVVTAEEAKRIRDALIRQATQPRSGTKLKGEAALLQDEEVKRLEALAMAKKLSRQANTRDHEERTSDVADVSIPEELRAAVEKGLLSVEEAQRIAQRAKEQKNSSSP